MAPAVALLVVALLATACGGTADDGPERVVLRFHRDGRVVDFEELREAQVVEDDVLLDPDTLEVVRMAPLEPARGATAAFEWSGRPVTLALSWPTSHGYSTLLLDVEGPGPLDVRQRDVEADVGRTLATMDRPPAAGARTGVTFDRLPSDADLDRAEAALAGAVGERWARLVIDPGTPAADAAAATRRIQARGIAVLAQLLDSSSDAELDDRAWRARLRDLVAAVPAEGWEVGNELNGEWLGPRAGERALEAAAYVKAHTDARTVATLYWQLGQSDRASSMFEWAARHLPARAAGDVDEVGISLWPEEAPMGAAFPRVVEALRRAYPGKAIAVGELGYGSRDGSGTWWWGSPDDRDEGRLAVARLYSKAGRALTDVAPFWWYFLDEVGPGTPLARAVATGG